MPRRCEWADSNCSTRSRNAVSPPHSASRNARRSRSVGFSKAAMKSVSSVIEYAPRNGRQTTVLEPEAAAIATSHGQAERSSLRLRDARPLLTPLHATWDRAARQAEFFSTGATSAIAAYSHARLYLHARSAVDSEISRHEAACSSVRPPKNRSSTSLAFCGSRSEN